MNQTQMQSAGRELIPVMHCFDNNYVIPAAVSFYSMLKYADPKYQYRLYVLHTDITTQNAAKCGEPISQCISGIYFDESLAGRCVSEIAA